MNGAQSLLTAVSRRVSRILSSALPVLLLAVIVSPALAGVFSVTPVRLYLAPRDRAIAVTVTNEGDEELLMQADIYAWKQKPGGEDELTPSEDLFLSPPIIKLAPKARQVVRLARLKVAVPTEQLTYRMIVREVPEAKPPKENIQVQLALAFSLPVFITPQGAKARLDCTVERIAPEAVRAVCENKGNAYAQPREFVLTNMTGGQLAIREGGGYILPTIKRTFDMKGAQGSSIPAGKSKLIVKLDDGTEQSYEVTIAD